MLIKYGILFLTGFLFFFIIHWLTGSEEYSGVKTKDDERKQLIKQKSIVNSWLLLLMFFIINFIVDIFDLRDERLALIPFAYPELFYLLIAIISYFIYYWIHNRRMSG